MLLNREFYKFSNDINVGMIKFYKICFYCMQVENYRNILKLSCRLIAFISYQAIFKKKTKRDLELVYLPQFLRDF